MVLYRLTSMASAAIRSPHNINKGKFYNLKYQKMPLEWRSNYWETQWRDNFRCCWAGKSIIGSATANNLDLRTIIIAPPHLVTQWDDYKDEFRFTASVFSRGVIGKALEYYRSKNHKRAMVNCNWRSTQLPERIAQDYALLHELNRNKVMLLTVTHSTTWVCRYIRHMIAPFQMTTKSTLQTVDNLGHESESDIHV